MGEINAASVDFATLLTSEYGSPGNSGQFLAQHRPLWLCEAKTGIPRQVKALQLAGSLLSAVAVCVATHLKYVLPEGATVPRLDEAQ
jgi:hypothetical protein